MTTEEMLEEVIQLSQKAYKKNSKGSKEWLKLQRHEDVIIDVSGVVGIEGEIK